MRASGSFLLDTNIVIASFAGDPSLRGRLDGKQPTFVPSIVLGELYFGALKSGRVAENVKRIDQFAERSAVLGCDGETSKVYGSIKHALRAKGRPIPENDIWIAAIARQHRLTLVTRDAHFQEVEGLDLEVW